MDPVAREAPGEQASTRPSILDVLRMEEIDLNLYRSTLVFADPFPL
jgi:acyl-CoA thioesterase-2